MDFAACWYSPKQGWFTTEDSYPPMMERPQSLNRYAYAENNPVNNTDPTGHFRCEGLTDQDFDNCLNPPSDPPPSCGGDPGEGTGGTGGDTGGGSTGGGSTGGSGGTGGSDGGSSTPAPTPQPTPSPEQIKAQKRSTLVNSAGTGKTTTSSMNKAGTTAKTNYGYIPKPAPPKQTVTTSGSQQWSSQYMSNSSYGYSRYSSISSSFLSPSKPPAPSTKKSSVLAKSATAVYNFLIGDSINTLIDPHASTFSKLLAGADIISNFIPGGTFAKAGGKLAAKGAVIAAKVLKEPAKLVIKATKDAVFDGFKKIGSWFGKKAEKVAEACNCFTAGTKVLTDKGEKPIEDIEIGDKVLSKDEETGEEAYKEVTDTFNHVADAIYKIHVGDQVIEATFNHPFWVDGKGWTFVKDLQVGDLLVQSDGNKIKVDSIEFEPKQVTVYI